MSEREHGWKIKSTSAFGCGILISNKSTLSFLTVDEAEAMLNEHAELKRENEELRNGGRRLLSALPDSVAHENPDCWEWCWNELDGDAQDEVKEARNYWNNILLAVEE